MVQKVKNAMIKYFEGDPRRVHHFMKVYAFASAIACAEEVDERTMQIIEIEIDLTNPQS